MWEEAMQIQQDEEREYDREQKATQHYDHDEHERAQYNEEVEQDIYERDDKMGAI